MVEARIRCTAVMTSLSHTTKSYSVTYLPKSDLSKRKFGHSRDKRHDCVQVVIALIVTPRGLPIAYEVMPGNKHLGQDNAVGLRAKD